jgi:hypothetical protein
MSDYSFSLPADCSADANQNASKGVVPEFFIEAIQNKPKSLEAGRPIYDDVEMVRIYTIGDKLNIPVHKVTERDIARWPNEYNAFKENIEVAIQGTPLEEWPQLTVSKVKELKSLKIKTVEQLADLPEASLKALGMGGRALVDQAKAYINKAVSNAEVNRVIEENNRLKTDIEMLKQQIGELKDGNLVEENVELRK